MLRHVLWQIADSTMADLTPMHVCYKDEVGEAGMLHVQIHTHRHKYEQEHHPRASPTQASLHPEHFTQNTTRT